MIGVDRVIVVEEQKPPAAGRVETDIGRVRSRQRCAVLVHETQWEASAAPAGIAMPSAARIDQDQLDIGIGLQRHCVQCRRQRRAVHAAHDDADQRCVAAAVRQRAARRTAHVFRCKQGRAAGSQVGRGHEFEGLGGLGAGRQRAGAEAVQVLHPRCGRAAAAPASAERLASIAAVMSTTRFGRPGSAISYRASRRGPLLRRSASMQARDKA